MTVYLASLIANENRDPGIPDNETVKWGLSKILEKLHNGISLDEIIKNTGRYGGIIDFEDRFATTEDDSIQFCVDFLNHLEEITLNNKKYAKGSILLPFDTDKDNALDGRTETSNGQSVMKIVQNDDIAYFNFVLSTVDAEKAKQSAGSYHTWDETDEWGIYAGTSAAAAKIVANKSDNTDDHSQEVGTTDNAGDTDASDSNDTGTEPDTGTPVDDTNATTTSTDTESTTHSADTDSTAPGADMASVAPDSDTETTVTGTDTDNTASSSTDMSATTPSTDTDNTTPSTENESTAPDFDTGSSAPDSDTGGADDGDSYDSTSDVPDNGDSDESSDDSDDDGDSDDADDDDSSDE